MVSQISPRINFDDVGRLPVLFPVRPISHHQPPNKRCKLHSALLAGCPKVRARNASKFDCASFRVSPISRVAGSPLTRFNRSESSRADRKTDSPNCKAVIRSVRLGSAALISSVRPDRNVRTVLVLLLPRWAVFLMSPLSPDSVLFGRRFMGLAPHVLQRFRF